MGVNMTLPAAFEDTLSTQEQIQWLYKYKEALLTAGANIQITRQGDTVVISAIGEGFSPTVEVTEIPGGHEVTITDGTGAHVFDVMDGVDGEDGVSPAVVITSITGGHRVVITDEDHPSGQSFDVMDGVDGTNGTSITVKSVTPVSGGVNLVITDSAGDHTIFLANGPQGLTGPQGPQGPTGATGAAGATGATPEITMTATSDGTYSATPTVTVVKGGTDLNPTFSLAFSGLRGQTGPQGPQGETGQQGPAGEDGEDGADGVTPVISATATADATSSDNPTVTVTKSGTDAAPSFEFAFSGLKGATGATGAQGPQGPAGQDGADGQDGTDGTDGVTPVITATATADATHSANPSVTVTKSGTDAAPSFAFAFSGLQGEQGPAGQDGQDGEGVPAHTSAEAGKVLGVDANGDTEWQTPAGGAISAELPTTTGVLKLIASDDTEVTITPDSIHRTMVIDSGNPMVMPAGGLYFSPSAQVVAKRLVYTLGDGTNSLTYTINGTSKTLPDGDYVETSSQAVGATAPVGKIGTCAFKVNTGFDGVVYKGSYFITVKGKQVILTVDFEQNVTIPAAPFFGSSFYLVFNDEYKAPAANGVPAGGTAGQVLQKVDGTDYNTEWATPSGGGGDKSFAVKDLHDFAAYGRETSFYTDSGTLVGTVSDFTSFTGNNNFAVVYRTCDIAGTTALEVYLRGYLRMTISTAMNNVRRLVLQLRPTRFGLGALTYDGVSYSLDSTMVLTHAPNVKYGSNSVMGLASHVNYAGVIELAIDFGQPVNIGTGTLEFSFSNGV